MDKNNVLSSTDAPLRHKNLIPFNFVPGIPAFSCQSESTWLLIFEAKPLWSFPWWFNPDLTSGLWRYKVNDPIYSAISLCMGNHCYSSQGSYCITWSSGCGVSPDYVGSWRRFQIATWNNLARGSGGSGLGETEGKAFWYSFCLCKQKPTTKSFAFFQWEAAWSLASSPIVTEFS